MTTAEKLIQKGMRKGMQQGMRQGILNERQEMLIELIETKFNRISEIDIAKIKKCNDLSKLGKAIKNVLIADTAEEIINLF